MRIFFVLLIVMLYANPVAARDVTGSGTVSAIGATLDSASGNAPSGDAVRDVTVHVTSTGAPTTGTATSATSSATATGVQGRNRTRYTADTVTAIAKSGNVTQHGTVVNMGSLSWSAGMQLSGRTPQTLSASDLSVRAVSGEVTGVSSGRRSQGRADSFAAGIWMLSNGDAALSGDSFVEAQAGTASVAGGDSLALATALAVGASVGQLGLPADNSLTHNGALTVRALGGTAISHGTDSYAEAWAEATGLQAVSGSVRNSGTIRVSAQGGTAEADTGDTALAHARAIGISATDTVRNSGDLTVTASSSVSVAATGIQTSGNVNNSGSVTVAASTPADTATATGTATGIQTSGNVDNSGSITVAASTPADTTTATGTATGIQTSGNVNNSGSITVAASGTATGVLFTGDGSLHSTAPIVISGGNPWEVVSATAGRSVTVSAYNLGLGRATNRTFGGPGNVVMDDATLTLRPAPGFVENRYFTVQSPETELVQTGQPGQTGQSDLGEAHISGQVGRVISTHPDLQAAVRSEGLGQAVALLYEPPASLPGESIHAQQTTVMYAGTVLRDHLAESLFMPALSSENHGQLFFRPYAMRLEHSGGPAGYRGTLSGALFGISGRVGDTLVGVHLGGDVTDLDFRGVYDGRSETSTTLYGGVHAGQRWDNGLGVMLTSSLFRADHRAEYDIEHATAQSLAWFNTLGLNWRWQLTEHQTLVPEVSLLHIWQFRNNTHTNPGPNSISTRFEEFSNQEVFGTAGLRWVAHMPAGSGILRLHTGGGVQQTFTNGRIRVEQFMEGTRHVQPSTQSDRTLGFASAGVGFDFERLSLDLGWQGSFSSHTQAQGIQAVVRYAF